MEAVEQEERLRDEVEAVGEFAYLGDRVSASGGCEVAVTAKTRCRWVKYWECCEIQGVERFLLRLNRIVYNSSMRPAILYGLEVWCLKESLIVIL